MENSTSCEPPSHTSESAPIPSERSVRCEDSLHTYLMQSLHELQMQQEASLQIITVMLKIFKESSLGLSEIEEKATALAPLPEALEASLQRIFGKLNEGKAEMISTDGTAEIVRPEPRALFAQNNCKQEEGKGQEEQDNEEAGKDKQDKEEREDKDNEDEKEEREKEKNDEQQESQPLQVRRVSFSELEEAEEKKEVERNEVEEYNGTSNRSLNQRKSKVIELLHGNSNDEVATHVSGVRGYLTKGSRWLLALPGFEYTMGIVILANSVCVGIETQWSIQDDGLRWPEIVDYFFLTVYIIELMVRFLALGLVKCLKDGWFMFDLFLVSCSCIGNLVIPIVTWVTGAEQGNTGFLASVLVIRSLRLLRLIRALRMLKYFRTVWRLVNGLLSSGNTMLSTCGLLSLTLYMFTCLGIELITKNTFLQEHEDTAEIVWRDFGSVPATFLTLVQFVTVDSVAAIYVPLIKQAPFLLFYFLLLIVIISIALMNLVTAVVVEGALDNAQADRDLEKHDLRQALIRAVPRLNDIFNDMDINGDGQVSLEEIQQVPLDVIPKELFSSDSVSSMEEVFELLDVDGEGELSQEEFVQGLLELFLTDVPVQTIQTLKLLRQNGKYIQTVRRDLESLRRDLARSDIVNKETGQAQA